MAARVPVCTPPLFGWGSVPVANLKTPVGCWGRSVAGAVVGTEALVVRVRPQAVVVRGVGDGDEIGAPGALDPWCGVAQQRDALAQPVGVGLDPAHLQAAAAELVLQPSHRPEQVVETALD